MIWYRNMAFGSCKSRFSYSASNCPNTMMNMRKHGGAFISHFQFTIGMSHSHLHINCHQHNQHTDFDCKLNDIWCVVHCQTAGKPSAHWSRSDVCACVVCQPVMKIQFRTILMCISFYVASIGLLLSRFSTCSRIWLIEHRIAIRIHADGDTNPVLLIPWTMARPSSFYGPC